MRISFSSVVRLHVPLLVLAVAVAPACGPPADSTVDIEFDPCVPLVIAAAPAATEDQRAGIDSAIAMWNGAAATRLTVDDVPGAERLPVLFEQAALAFRGLYDDERGEVLINQGLVDPHQRAVVIAHELGHAFGLQHVSGRSSLMNGGNLRIEPTAEDVTALVARWGRCDQR